MKFINLASSLVFVTLVFNSIPEAISKRDSTGSSNGGELVATFNQKYGASLHCVQQKVVPKRVRRFLQLGAVLSPLTELISPITSQNLEGVTTVYVVQKSGGSLTKALGHVLGGTLLGLDEILSILGLGRTTTIKLRGVASSGLMVDGRMYETQVARQNSLRFQRVVEDQNGPAGNYKYADDQFLVCNQGAAGGDINGQRGNANGFGGGGDDGNQNGNGGAGGHVSNAEIKNMLTSMRNERTKVNVTIHNSAN